MWICLFTSTRAQERVQIHTHIHAKHVLLSDLAWKVNAHALFECLENRYDIQAYSMWLLRNLIFQSPPWFPLTLGNSLFLTSYNPNDLLLTDRDISPAPGPMWATHAMHYSRYFRTDGCLSLSSLLGRRLRGTWWRHFAVFSFSLNVPLTVSAF